LLHHAEEGRPVQPAAALELQGTGLPEPRGVACPEGVATFIQAAPAGPAEHLQQLVGPHLALRMVGGVTAVRHEHRAEREIDARGQTGRGDDHVEPAGLRPGFDQVAPLFVGQAAVVQAHALAQQAVEVVAGDGPLGGRQMRAIAQGESLGDLAGDLFRCPAAGGEDQDRPEVGQDRPHHRPGDVALDAARFPALQGVQRDLLQGDRSTLFLNQGHGPAKVPQPFGHRPGVGHAAAQEQEPGLRRGQRQDGLVGRPPPFIGQHLVLVDDEEVRTASLEEAVALRLQGGHDHGGAEVFADVPGGDAHVPTQGAPLGPLIVGQGPGRHGVDGLPAVAMPHQQFEDVGLARAGGGLDHHVLALAEGAERFLLPQVGEDEPLVRHGEFPAKDGPPRTQAAGVCGCGFSAVHATTAVAWPSAPTSPAA
jgi:hypothetical protein